MNTAAAVRCLHIDASRDVARDAHELTDAPGEHEQMPDSMSVPDALVIDEKINADAVNDAAGQQPCRARGRQSLDEASTAVRSVEARMLAGLTGTEQSEAFRILQSMIHSLRGDDEGA